MFLHIFSGLANHIEYVLLYLFVISNLSLSKDGRLYYVGPKKEEKREVVIEPEQKRQIFQECHFNDIGHHLGQKKTVHRIQSKYYWLGIVKDVVDWVCSGNHWSGPFRNGCVCYCHVCIHTFIWKSLYHLFQIKVCETCQHAERNKNLARTVRPIKVDGPWDILAVEIIGKGF